MNQRFLVNKVIALSALLSFGQTQVVVSFCSDSNLSLKCLYLLLFFKVARLDFFRAIPPKFEP